MSVLFCLLLLSLLMRLFDQHEIKSRESEYSEWIFFVFYTYNNNHTSSLATLYIYIVSLQVREQDSKNNIILQRGEKTTERVKVLKICIYLYKV